MTIWNRLLAPCDIASTAFLRAAFGLAVLSHVILYFHYDFIDLYFGPTPHHLSFFGFEWVHALDASGMRRVYWLMGFAAVGVTLGLLYRLSAVTLFLTFTYALFADATQSQNHFYMICLVAFLFVLIPAHQSFSIDSILVPNRASPWIPNWCRWLLMFQIAIPYVYGGIAKLNADWMQAMPVGMWLAEKSDLPLIGPLLTERWFAWFISYTGIIFDLLIVPLLLWNRTRRWAFAAVLFFHLTNSVLFNIDVFPWMMMLATPILFSADWPRKLLRLEPPALPEGNASTTERPSLRERLTLGFVGFYVAWQLLFPFRHFLYPGDPSWTEEGQQFAWRMMLRRKDVYLRIYATDGPSQRVSLLPLKNLMPYRQLLKMSYSPDQIVACAPYFAEKAEEMGLQDVEIRAVVLTSLNGRKPQLQIDPELNLLTVERSLRPQEGIVPLTEPLRTDPWDIPSRQWPEMLGIQLPDAR